MEAVPARAGFVREHEMRRFRVTAPHQLRDVRLAGTDRTDKHGRIGALPHRMRHGDRIFVDVQTDEKRSRLCND